MASLKAITILASLRTPFAPSAGVVDTMAGPVQSPDEGAQSPLESHVSCWVPEHRLLPGLHDPAHAPAMHTKGQGAPGSHFPPLHTSGVLPAAHLFAPQTHTPASWGGAGDVSSASAVSAATTLPSSRTVSFLEVSRTASFWGVSGMP